MRFKSTKSKGLRALVAMAATSVVMVFGASSAYSVSLVPDYMIIANANGGQGAAFHSNDVELGAINYSNQASDPSNDKGVSVGYQSPLDGTIGLNGDVAVTASDGTIALERTDIHSSDTGYANQGIDCAASFGRCTPSELKDNRYNTVVPGDNFTGVANNNGVQGDQNHAALLTELSNSSTNFWNNAVTPQTGMLDLSGAGGKIEDTDSGQFFDSSYGSGLNVIDIKTGSNDFLLNNVTWRIDGNADTKVIFRIEKDANFLVSNANIYVSDDMMLDSVLFLVDGKQGAASMNFSNMFFQGISFWDFGGQASDNYTNFNDVMGCGQVVNDRVNFNDVSMNGCAFSPTVIPLPAAFPLFGAGLALVGFVGWRRRNAA